MQSTKFYVGDILTEQQVNEVKAFLEQRQSVEVHIDIQNKEVRVTHDPSISVETLRDDIRSLGYTPAEFLKDVKVTALGNIPLFVPEMQMFAKKNIVSYDQERSKKETTEEYIEYGFESTPLNQPLYGMTSPIPVQEERIEEDKNTISYGVDQIEQVAPVQAHVVQSSNPEGIRKKREVVDPKEIDLLLEEVSALLDHKDERQESIFPKETKQTTNNAQYFHTASKEEIQPHVSKEEPVAVSVHATHPKEAPKKQSPFLAPQEHQEVKENKTKVASSPIKNEKISENIQVEMEKKDDVVSSEKKTSEATTVLNQPKTSSFRDVLAQYIKAPEKKEKKEEATVLQSTTEAPVSVTIPKEEEVFIQHTEEVQEVKDAQVLELFEAKEKQEEKVEETPSIQEQTKRNMFSVQTIKIRKEDLQKAVSAVEALASEQIVEHQEEVKEIPLRTVHTVESMNEEKEIDISIDKMIGVEQTINPIAPPTPKEIKREEVNNSIDSMNQGAVPLYAKPKEDRVPKRSLEDQYTKEGLELLEELRTMHTIEPAERTKPEVTESVAKQEYEDDNVTIENENHSIKIPQNLQESNLQVSQNEALDQILQEENKSEIQPQKQSTFFVGDMNCANCETKIIDALSKFTGIIPKIDLKAKEVTIKHDGSYSDEEFQNTLKAIGYTPYANIMKRTKQELKDNEEETIKEEIETSPLENKITKEDVQEYTYDTLPLHTNANIETAVAEIPNTVKTYITVDNMNTGIFERIQEAIQTSGHGKVRKHVLEIEHESTISDTALLKDIVGLGMTPKLIEQNTKSLENNVNKHHHTHEDAPQDIRHGSFQTKGKEVHLSIPTMDCATCATKVSKALDDLGVIDYEIYSVSKSGKAILPSGISSHDVEQKLGSIGYKTTVTSNEKAYHKAETNEEHLKRNRNNLIGMTIVAAPFLYMMLRHLGLFFLPAPVFIDDSYAASPYIQWILSSIIIFYFGRKFYRASYYALKNKTVDMHLTVSLAATVAYLFSISQIIRGLSTGAMPHHLYFETAVEIIWFISLGHYMEDVVMDRSNKTLSGLKALFSTSANKIVDEEEGTTREIPIDQIQISDLVVVKSSERIPLDGVVVSGEGYVDSSMLTGEPIPEHVEKDTHVIGSTLLTSGELVVRVTTPSNASTLSSIVDAVQLAQNARPNIQRIGDRIAQIFIPSILTISLLTFIVWYIISGDPVRSLETAIAVLVISCPCSLGLATPTAILTGTSRGTKYGIVYRDGQVFERYKKFDAIAFDKTGTLTVGKPKVTYFGGTKEDLTLMARMEYGIDHPLAQSVVEYARSRVVFTFHPIEKEEHVGFGVLAREEGHLYLLGSRKYMEQHNIDLKQFEYAIDEAMQKGETPLIFACDGVAKGLAIIADEIKENAPQIVKEYQEEGIHVYMITGDSEKAAQSIAQKLGIPSDHIYASVLPIDKQRIIKEIKTKHETVVMVGDGINDAPALAESSLGVSMGTGSAIAIENSDITITNGDILGIRRALRLSEKILRTIKENFFWAFSYNIVAVPLAIFGIVTPLFAAIFMAFSDVFVVLNSLKLLNYRFKEKDTNK